ncbi:MAG: type II toxin-antitoxin system HicA family toxin [Coriobacteriia bacterium]|nr:type II toxin-antitoxin system HicA family toxin [Coriobacteriia bacterium]
MDIFTDKEVIARLKKEGWEEIKGGGKGSHRKFKHPKFGTTVIPKGALHPNTYMSIARKVGWR